MKFLNIQTLGGLAIAITLACTAQEEFSSFDERESEFDDRLRTTNARIFYNLQNPNGNADSVRITAELAGNGQIVSLSLASHGGVFEPLSMACGPDEANLCRKRVDLGGCGNLGPLMVTVKYTGDVEPRLWYWFYDC